MAGRSLVMSKERMDKIDEGQKMGLKIPQDASVKGVGEGASYTWTEPFQIADATHGVDKNNEAWDLVVVTFKVPKDAQDSVNAGKTYPVWYRCNTEAIEDEKHADHMMSIINAGRLQGLVKAAGFDLEDQDLFSFFQSEDKDSPAPIVGAAVTAKIQDKPGKNKKTGEDIRRQEPIQFFGAV